MERIRIRPLALGLIALAGLAFVSIPGRDADAGAIRPPAAESLSDTLPHVQVLPALLPNSKENTSAIAQNTGSAAATIAMDIYTPAGVLIPSASQVFTNVPVGGTRTFVQALNTGLAPGFRGVGVISSDQPFDALLVRDIENNSNFAKSYSVHNAYPTGGNTVTLPYIANNLGGLFNTRFAIANTGNATACVTVAYAFDGGGGHTDNGPGGSGCASGYPVPVGGQVSFAPTAIDTALAMPNQTNNRLMSATLTSTGAPITVAVDAYLAQPYKKLGSYDGFVVGGTDDIGTSILIPLAIKFGGFYSQILLSNTNATPANATITYRDQGGTTYNVPITVPANGTANHSVYSVGSPIPEGFVGAATVTSDQPIAAVLFRAKKVTPTSEEDEDLYTAVNGIPTDRAATTINLPLIFRRVGAGGGFSGYNTWVSVVVADGSTANVTLKTVTDAANTPGSCGAAAQYQTTKAVNGSFVFYQNLDADNGLGANPACLWGGMTITSDKPIIAIANSTNDIFLGDNDGLYNGFPH